MSRWLVLAVLATAVQAKQQATIYYQHRSTDRPLLETVPNLSPPETNAVLSHRLSISRFEAIPPTFKFPHLLEPEEILGQGPTLIILHSGGRPGEEKLRPTFECRQGTSGPDEVDFIKLFKTYNERFAATRNLKVHDEGGERWIASSSSDHRADLARVLNSSSALAVERTFSGDELERLLESSGNAKVIVVALHQSHKEPLSMDSLQERIASFLPKSLQKRSTSSRDIFSTAHWRRDQDASLASSMINKRALTPQGLCFASEDEVAKATNNCTGHGKPAKAEVPIPYDPSQACFICSCQPTINRTLSGGTVTTIWTGSACEKMDMSSQFNLLFWSSIALTLVIAMSIRFLMSVGSDPLPNQLSAGVAPVRKD